MLRGVLFGTGNQMHFDASRVRMNLRVLLRNLVGSHLRLRERCPRLKIGSPSPECLACPAVQCDHLKAKKKNFIILTLVTFFGEFRNIRSA